MYGAGICLVGGYEVGKNGADHGRVGVTVERLERERLRHDVSLAETAGHFFEEDLREVDLESRIRGRTDGHGRVLEVDAQGLCGVREQARDVRRCIVDELNLPRDAECGVEDVFRINRSKRAVVLDLLVDLQIHGSHLDA